MSEENNFTEKNCQLDLKKIEISYWLDFSKEILVWVRNL